MQIRPLRNVDYLSHDWKEEDIWTSWKHIISERKVYNDSARLENASWRAWMKSKNKLKRSLQNHSIGGTSSVAIPGRKHWAMLTFTRLKDCDVTWLYGPLQTRPDELSERSSSLISSSGTSKFNSFMLKDAGPRMPEQQSREAERKLGQSCISQAVSDYKASLSAGSEKHVRFNE